MPIDLKTVPEWLVEYEADVEDVPITRITKEELLVQLKTSPNEVALVDLRNEIKDKGAIRKALHIPATIIHGPNDVQESLLTQVRKQRPDARRIVLFCNRSGRRPSYVGGWVKKHLEKEKSNEWDVVILDEGIAGWVRGGDKFKDETDYYSAA